MNNLKITIVCLAMVIAAACNNDNAGAKDGVIDTQPDSNSLPHMDTGNSSFVDTTRQSADTGDHSKPKPQSNPAIP